MKKKSFGLLILTIPLLLQAQNRTAKDTLQIKGGGYRILQESFPDRLCNGNGSESTPFITADGTAGLQATVNSLANGGGIINLSPFKYVITQGVDITSAAITISGGAFGGNLDPNGLRYNPKGSRLFVTSNYGIKLKGGFHAQQARLAGLNLEKLYMYGDKYGAWVPESSNYQTGIIVEGGLDQPHYSDINLGGFDIGILVRSPGELSDLSYFNRINILGGRKGVLYDNANCVYQKWTDCTVADQLEHCYDITGYNPTGEGVLLNCTAVRGGGADNFTQRPCNVYLGCKGWKMIGGESSLAGVRYQQPQYPDGPSNTPVDGIILAADNTIASLVSITENTGYGIRVKSGVNGAVIRANIFRGNALGDIIIESGAVNTVVDAPGAIVVDNGTNTVFVGGASGVNSISTPSFIFSGNTYQKSLEYVPANGVAGIVSTSGNTIRMDVPNGEARYVANTGTKFNKIKMVVDSVPMSGQLKIIPAYKDANNFFMVDVANAEVVQRKNGNYNLLRAPNSATTTTNGDILTIWYSPNGRVYWQKNEDIIIDLVGVDSSDLGNNASLWFYRTSGLQISNVAYSNKNISIADSIFLSRNLKRQKITLWDSTGNGNNFFGFGVENGTFRYQVANSNVDDHVFYSGLNASTSLELLRIKGDGTGVGIGTNTPANTLDVNGGITTRFLMKYENAAVIPAPPSSGCILYASGDKLFYHCAGDIARSLP